MTQLDAFAALGLDADTLDALATKGFEEPSPIQSAAIPLLLSGEKDVIAQAQTGTGKTAAFGIPILQTLTPFQNRVQAIILAPTRELSIQIADEMNSLRGKRAHVIAPMYGGQNIDIQLRRLRAGVDIVVGTPGRVIDLIERKALDISHVDYAILDEADEMLNMGFVEDIEKILTFTPKEKRMLMFSATMPSPILTIAERCMREYVRVNVKNEHKTPDLTDQIYFEVRNEDKLEALTRIIDMEQDMFAMVFCRTKMDVDFLAQKLNARGYLVEALHGDIAQAQRTRVIERFKARKFDILIATDVAARGIDVNNLTHVINYALPQGAEAYIHRVGRTGRAGKSGTAITFVTPSEFRKLAYLKREVKGEIRKESLPQPEDIVARKKIQVTERIQKVVENERHLPYEIFAHELLEKFTPLQLASAMLRMSYKTSLLPESYAELSPVKPRPKRGEKDVARLGDVRLFIALGKEQGYGPKLLLDLLKKRAGVRPSSIGKIDCLDKFSFINAPLETTEKLMDAFRDFGHKKAPFIEIAKAVEEGAQKTKKKKEGEFASPENGHDLSTYGEADFSDVGFKSKPKFKTKSKSKPGAFKGEAKFGGKRKKGDAFYDKSGTKPKRKSGPFDAPKPTRKFRKP